MIAILLVKLLMTAAITKEAISASAVLTDSSGSRRTIDWVARREVVEGLTHPADSIYIRDRLLLETIKPAYCTDEVITFSTVTTAGQLLSVTIRSGVFDRTKHHLIVDSTDYVYNGIRHRSYMVPDNLIDGQEAYGYDGMLPDKEIAELSIEWNNEKISIPVSAYSNLFAPTLCSTLAPVEVYVTKDNQLFLYISGGDGAGSYCAKLIFNSERFIGKIIALNESGNCYDYLDGVIVEEKRIAK